MRVTLRDTIPDLGIANVNSVVRQMNMEEVPRKDMPDLNYDSEVIDPESDYSQTPLRKSRSH